MISLIWAMDKDWLIGKDNLLPWHYKKDLEYLKRMTMNQTVLMGDMTYDSLKSYYKTKPFPYKNVFVATLTDRDFEGAQVVKDIDAFLKEYKDGELFVIGGRTIYKLALPYADRLYITFIDKSHEGNVYFPKFDLESFQLVKETVDEPLRFTLYEKVIK